MTPTITFVKVQDNLSKLLKLTQIVTEQFYQGVSILIAVPNSEAGHYIDQLLWRLPEDSFLPHVAAEDSTKEKIVITTSNTNLNNASVLFNLCPGVNPNFRDFESIYELYDETHASKEELSRQRQAFYHAQGLNTLLH